MSHTKNTSLSQGHVAFTKHIEIYTKLFNIFIAHGIFSNKDNPFLKRVKDQMLSISKKKLQSLSYA